MTLDELIAELQDMRCRVGGNVPVIYACFSEYEVLNHGDVKIVLDSEHRDFEGVILHKGRYIEYRRYYFKTDELGSLLEPGDGPNFQTVVKFPGN